MAKTCQKCGKAGLVWKQTPAGFRLYEPNGAVRHTCSAKVPTPDNTPKGEPGGIDTYSPKFANFTEMLAQCEKEPRPNSPARQSRSVGTRDFNQTETFEECLKVAREGWPEGYANIRSLASTIFDLVSDKVVRPTIIHEVTGDMLDMGAFMEGVPECFLQWKEAEETVTGSNQVIRLVFNCAASCGIRRETLIARGAVAVALAEALELSGRRVEIILAESVNTWAGDGFEMFTVVKESWAPIQGDQLAFALCHPDVLRRLVFSLQEQTPKPRNAGVGQGYGTPQEVVNKKDQGNIYIPMAHYDHQQWENPKSAEAWILKTLREQGVELEGESEV